MDKQNPKQKYTGRFGDSTASGQPKVNPVPRRTNKAGEDTRRPSGFGSAGQPTKRKTAAQTADPKAAETKKARRIKKERKAKQERAPREKKPRRGLKVLIVIVVLLAAALTAIVLIFGDSSTYHQMPTIQREEAQPSFAPEQTPFPGLEVS